MKRRIFIWISTATTLIIYFLEGNSMSELNNSRLIAKPISLLYRSISETIHRCIILIYVNRINTINSINRLQIENLLKLKINQDLHFNSVVPR